MSLLSVRNLSFGENVILENVDADTKKGEVITIIGSSGTGKSKDMSDDDMKAVAGGSSNCYTTQFSGM
jgi:ABC-type transporter Mla maintaining outer membrane lipid asymmetry ATPase subunit MlaF